MSGPNIGIVGLDSSHAAAFTRIFNNQPNYSLGRIVAAARGLPTDFPLSVNRRDQVEESLKKEFGIPIVDSIDELASIVDGALIISCDGRCHASEARPVIAARKPLFIDKPLCSNWREAQRLISYAHFNRCPLFSASALRFRPILQPPGDLNEIAVTVPNIREPHHPDLSWHGIHGVEAAFAHFGKGWATVSRQIDSQKDITTVAWEDGKVAKIHRTSEVSAKEFPVSSIDCPTVSGFSYLPLILTISNFLVTGTPPVHPLETIEVLQVIDAADLSVQRNGATISLRELTSTDN